MVDMRTTVAAVTLPNPVLTASGCAAAGRELDQFFDVSALGAVVTKSIMVRPRSGRPTPRMAETPSGMLNSIGLQGPGIDAFVAHDLAWLAERGARVVVSIAGGHTDEYVALTERAASHPAVSMIEVNISCPNVESRGQVFACDPAASARVISAVRRTAADRVPILAKLSPDVTDITVIARACVGRRRRRAVAHQHLARHGDRHRQDGAGPRRHHRRAVRTGNTSGRRAVRLAGPPGPPAPCRSSARAASAAGWTRCSSSWPGHPRCRSGRRCSAIRLPRCGCWLSWSARWPTASSRPFATRLGMPTWPKTSARAGYR